LNNFGSNSKANDIISFVQKKYDIQLKYSQAYHIIQQLDPYHKYGDAADYLCFLLEKDYQIYYELCSESNLDLLIFTSPFQQIMAEKFGTVMFFDTIVGTNVYNRIRATLSIQLPNGRIMPVLHALLPNQETTSFEKVFEIGLKQLLNIPKTLFTDQDPAIIRAIKNCLKDSTYHVYCARHAKENASKYFAPILKMDNYKEISAENKLKIHSKILNLFNQSSEEKANKDLLWLEEMIPEGSLKKYFLELKEKKQSLFPPFIKTFTGGHFTTNIAESINNIIRSLRKSSGLTEEIELLKSKLPGDVYQSNIRLTKFQMKFLEKSPILSHYKNIYTDYALEILLENFMNAQELQLEKKGDKVEVYQIGSLEQDGQKVSYRKNIQNV